MRGLTTVVEMPFLDPSIEVVFEGGKVVDVRKATGTAQIRFKGPDTFYTGYMAEERRPGFESLTAGGMKGVQLDGIDEFTLHSYTGAFGYLLEATRQALHGVQEVPIPKEYPFKATDNAVGRYVYVTIDGVEVRMYYEESGTGTVPFLLQHTAGADGREYRHVLADPEIQKNFRIIAYDLPFHGRSLPPEGERWWEEDYKPTKHSLMNAIVAFSEALKLDRPVFMGCSIGGNLALDLAAHHKDKFRAFIALNGLYYGLLDSPPPESYRDPRYHPDMYASQCLGATSPVAPEAWRQEVYFIYRSNAPGIFAGDVDYFSVGHDLREDGHMIDTNMTPVYSLTGEYDPSVHNDERGAAAVARNIPGIRARIMPGLGHFAPSDNPMMFREELLPVLDEILDITS
jgi:pimeloyl-ACP methyl ester carboxylesterase